MTLLAPVPDPSGPRSLRDLGGRDDHVAVITSTATLSYGELDRQVTELAGALGAERRLVAVEATNSISSLVAYLGARRAGHPVLLLPPEDDRRARSVVDAYDPDVILRAGTEVRIARRRSGTAHTLHPDLALLLSTSGSTGSPKLVRLSEENLEANAAAIATYLRLGPDDRAVTTLPMQYCYGLSVINSHLIAGATLVLTELSVVDRCFWDLFRSAGGTGLAGVPHTFDLLDRVGFATMELPTLRRVTQAGGRLHPDLVRRYATLGERRGWELFVMYGQTEATARMAYLPPALARSRPTCIGVPIPGGSLSIDEPDAEGVGELVYRGANVMLGYADEPADLASGATVEALHTGDLARRTPDGLYEIVGRRSRFVKPYGLRVDLDRLERLLADHGITALCAGDDERLVAGVERAARVPAAERLLAEHLALPRSAVTVVHVGELPRLSNGKADHARLLQLASVVTERAAPRDGPGDGDRSAQVRAAFADVLGREPAGEDSFVSLGGDSLSYVEMSMRLEEILGTLPRDWHLRRIDDLQPERRPGRVMAPTDTTAIVRASAIVLIVATHAGLWRLPGGAHALLAVAGYNFGRFQHRAGSMAASIARIVVPSVCWISVVAALGDKYGWPNALLINGLYVRPGDRWGYWFIEALVHILVPLALLSAVPAIARLDRARPTVLPCLVLAAGLAVRFDVVDVTTTRPTSRPLEVFWLFALGWAAARATGWRLRALVTGLAAVGLAGFFGDPSRELIVLGGIVLTTWLPTIPVPRLARRVIAPLAGASLYIYLTHFQVFPPLDRLGGPAVAVAGSLAVGVGAWMVGQPLVDRGERALRERWRARRTSTPVGARSYGDEPGGGACRATPRSSSSSTMS